MVQNSYRSGQSRQALKTGMTFLSQLKCSVFTYSFSQPILLTNSVSVFYLLEFVNSSLLCNSSYQSFHLPLPIHFFPLLGSLAQSYAFQPVSSLPFLSSVIPKPSFFLSLSDFIQALFFLYYSFNIFSPSPLKISSPLFPLLMLGSS